MSRHASAVEVCARCADAGIARRGTLDDGVHWFCDEHLDPSGDPPNWGDCDQCGAVTWRYRVAVSTDEVLRFCDDCLPEWLR
mgnify:CR=1 FL=1